MKKIKQKIVIFSVLLIHGWVIYAGNQNVGTTSAMFKTLLNPKVVALGGAYLTFSDVDAISVNPAGLAKLEKIHLSLAYTSWLVDTNYNYLAFGMSAGSIGSFGLMINYFSSGNIEYTDINGPSGGTYSANGLLASLVYSRAFGGQFSVGLAMKYISQTLEKESASTPSMDVGSIFELNEKIKFALSLQNLFGSIKFIEQEDKLPMVIKVASGFNFVNNLSTVLDISVPLDSNITVGFGIEYNIKISEFILPVRLGYRSGNDVLLGVNAGVGFGYKDIVCLNISWSPGLPELQQNSLNAGINFKF
ncbi:MAG: PorV/PorQ family protein [Endomicrobia bacterium]|nr:PorV/PorQ family protein [Endomicrobiia bacterium]